MLLHEILTTEKVPFTYRVAGMGSRFLAWLIDALLMSLLVFGGLLAGSVLDALRPGLGTAVFLVGMFVVTWGYFLFFEWLWHGQTPGKRLLGIRVIQWRGTGIAFYQAAVRNILRVVDSLPWLLILGFYGLGFLVAACNRRQRRLGDLAAGTLVVHVDRKTRPIQALHDASGLIEFPQEGLVRQRLAQLGRDQKQTLLDLCIRREQLRVQDRARLFGAVADYFKAVLEIAPARYQSDEKFVLQMIAVLAEESGMQPAAAGRVI
jgi:uncharacterized RDD family membrane protein YckC